MEVSPIIKLLTFIKLEYNLIILYFLAVILLIYLPIAIAGYLVYGENIDDNVILSLKKSSLVTAANCFMAMHLISAFLIIINPASQEIENFLNIPESKLHLYFPIILLQNYERIFIFYLI